MTELNIKNTTKILNSINPQEVSSSLIECDSGLLESPIEEITYECLLKLINENTYIVLQKSIRTVSGDFRLDIVLRKGEKEIAIECDGEEFHGSDKKQYCDEWRDALILFSSKISSIFRLKGSDINADVYGLIFFVASKEPDFFCPEKLFRFQNIVNSCFYQNSINNTTSAVNGHTITIDWSDTNKKITTRTFRIYWKNIYKSWDRFWDRLVLISCLNPHKKITELFELKHLYNDLNTKDFHKKIDNMYNT